MILEVGLKTKKPSEDFATITSIVHALFGQKLTPKWSPKGTIVFQFSFPNSDQAQTAVYRINTAFNDCEEGATLRFGMTDEPAEISTHDGHVLLAGPGSKVASIKRKNGRDPRINSKIEGRDQIVTPSEMRRLSVPFRKDISPRAAEHAETITQSPTETIRQATEVLIYLPKISDHEIRARMTAYVIEALSRHNARILDSTTDPIRIFIAEERAVGNLGQRLAQRLKNYEKYQIGIIARHANIETEILDDGTVIIHTDTPDPLDIGRPKAGLWMDEATLDLAGNARNRSLATFTTERESERGFTKVKAIKSAEYRLITDASHLVGREAESGAITALLQSVRNEKRPRFITVLGEPGIGKTELVAQVLQNAERTGFRVVSYKIPEDGTSQHRSTVSKLISGLLPLFSAQGGDTYEILRSFAEGRTPKGSPLATTIETYKSNPARLAKILAEALQEAAKGGPIALAIDDLQWTDEFSKIALSKLAGELANDQNPLALIFLGRIAEQSTTREITEAAIEKNHTTQEIRLAPLFNDGTAEAERTHLTEELIRSHLPRRMRSAVIPQTFVLEMMAFSRGLPIIITETLALLSQRNQLSSRAGSLVVPATAALEELSRKESSATLASILERRLQLLPPNEKLVTNLMAIVGTIDLEIFYHLHEKIYGDEHDLDKTIDALVEKDIVRKSPLAFANDSMLAICKSQGATSGAQSQIAYDSYGALRVLQASRPALAPKITPKLVYELLQKAGTGGQEMLDSATGAIRYCLDTRQHRAAIRATETLITTLEIHTERTLRKQEAEADEDEMKRLSELLATSYQQAAETYLRVEDHANAKAALEKLDELRDQIPALASLFDGKNGLGLFVLKLRAARIAPRSEADGEKTVALTALETAINTLSPGDSESAEAENPQITLARGEVLARKMQILSDNQDREGIEKIDHDGSVNDQILKLMRLGRVGNDPKTKNAAKALAQDLESKLVQIRFHLIDRLDIAGPVGEEALYLQVPTEIQQRILRENNRRFKELIELYATKPELLRDPDTYGYLLEGMARIKILLANTGTDSETHAEAEAAIEKALEVATNFDLPHIICRTRTTRGNWLIAKSLSTYNPNRGLRNSRVNKDQLENAIREFNLGIAEMARGQQLDNDNAKEAMAYKAMATAILIISHPPQTPAEKDLRTQQLLEAWERHRIVLEYLYNLRMQNSAFAKYYYNELSNTGLLIQAGQILGIAATLNLPTNIRNLSDDFTAALRGSTRDITSMRDLSPGSQRLLHLRKEGIANCSTG
ncbi:AAA family ATPase [Candidatus Peregrinibacteria bacterium]|nr:AAA family ATPase [Candidatus Peregrinibacteria bacterium]